MKSFTPVVWDLAQARVEVERLRTLLAAKTDLSEAGDILPLFRSCPQLSLSVGDSYAPGGNPDWLAFEYDLFGDFACDLVVGSPRRKSYVFVEFESAKSDSIFRRQGRKTTRECALSFSRGFFQIVDWFTKLASLEKTDDFENRFGARAIDYRGLLVIGRDAFVDPSERRRLQWWRTHFIVNSRQIHCVTYDELLADLTLLLARYERPRKHRGRKT